MHNTTHNPDLKVDINSRALEGTEIDLIVGGSIGAVESVRFIRALRRLGGNVRVIMSPGAKLFTTKDALEWASNNPVIENFSGFAPHIATGDLLLICPASASLIGKIAQGICDTPATTLVQSYLGMSKPVQLLPNMHSSLADSPFVSSNFGKLIDYITILEPRVEEGKSKFPEPRILADMVSHNYNKHKHRDPKSALVCMGSTKGYFDDIRYISNYSSGGLGSKISEELFRQGINVHVVCGSVEILPHLYSSMTRVSTNQQMEEECKQLIDENKGNIEVVMLASVLDYVPKQTSSGKIRSGSNSLTAELIPTEKIISKLNPASGHKKIGFKLEPSLTESQAKEIAQDYCNKYGLSFMVLNSFSDVSPGKHKAYMFADKANSDSSAIIGLSKQEIASVIHKHIID